MSGVNRPWYGVVAQTPSPWVVTENPHVNDGAASTYCCREHFCSQGWPDLCQIWRLSWRARPRPPEWARVIGAPCALRTAEHIAQMRVPRGRACLDRRNASSKRPLSPHLHPYTSQSVRWLPNPRGFGSETKLWPQVQAQSELGGDSPECSCACRRLKCHILVTPAFNGQAPNPWCGHQNTGQLAQYQLW